MGVKHGHVSARYVDMLAAQAVTHYELSCDWNRTRAAIREDVSELLGIPNRAVRGSLVGLISKHAQVKWQARQMATRREIARELRCDPSAREVVA